MSKGTTCFISYSWESEEHSLWVRALAESLTRDGVTVILDQWDVTPGDQLPAFMEKLSYCDYVLIICTSVYAQRANAREQAVGTETNIMAGELLYSKDEQKFIPVLREGAWNTSVPVWLMGKFGVDLRATPYERAEYIKLVNTLLGRGTKHPITGYALPPSMTDEYLSKRVKYAFAFYKYRDYKSIYTKRTIYCQDYNSTLNQLVQMLQNIDRRFTVIPFYCCETNYGASSDTLCNHVYVDETEFNERAENGYFIKRCNHLALSYESIIAAVQKGGLPFLYCDSVDVLKQFVPSAKRVVLLDDNDFAILNCSDEERLGRYCDWDNYPGKLPDYVVRIVFESQSWNSFLPINQIDRIIDFLPELSNLGE